MWHYGFLDMLTLFLKLVSVFIVGVVLIRVAEYVINNFVDCNIDQHICRI